MSGAQAAGEPSTRMRRIGVAKWLVCHTIKGLCEKSGQVPPPMPVFSSIGTVSFIIKYY